MLNLFKIEDEQMEHLNEFLYLKSMFTKDERYWKCMKNSAKARAKEGNKVNGALRIIMIYQMNVLFPFTGFTRRCQKRPIVEELLCFVTQLIYVWPESWAKQKSYY